MENKKQGVHHGREEGEIYGLNLGEKGGDQGQEAGEKQIDPGGVEDLEGVFGNQCGGDSAPVEGQGARGEKENVVFRLGLTPGPGAAVWSASQDRFLLPDTTRAGSNGSRPNP